MCTRNVATLKDIHKGDEIDRGSVSTDHFQFNRTGITGDEHAHAMCNGLVTCTVVWQYERKIDRFMRCLDLEIPIAIWAVFYFLCPGDLIELFSIS